MDNGNFREDVELENMVALLTFESGLTIMDVDENYRPADRAIAISASETTTIGWSIGGGLVALCAIITAVIIGVVCYKLTSGCLPVRRLLKWSTSTSTPLEKPTGQNMEMAFMKDAHTMEMAQHPNQTFLYPVQEVWAAGTLVNTGGGVTPERATAPVEVQVYGDNRPVVGTSRV
jgi:hypothetical protein